MSLNLSASDLIKIGPISSKNTLQCFEISDKKKKQKIVVGDDSGSLYCFEMKKGEMHNVFKTTPLSAPVTCVQLGKAGSDKAFASSGQQILGFNKKGKDFFRFQSNLAETINSICVLESKLWTVTDYVYNQYDNGEDKYFHMCQDRINALIIENLTNEDEPDAIIGCEDKNFRVLKASDVAMKKSVSSRITALGKVLPKEGERYSKQFIYGTSTGNLGQILSKTTKLKSGWKIKPQGASSTINCLKSFDFTKDGFPEVLVGSDDGKVQIFRINEAGDTTCEFEHIEPESIRGIEAGVINTPDFNEVIATTYSGRVVSYTTEPLDQPDAEDSYGRTRGTVQRENRIGKLKKDIALLQKEILKAADSVGLSASEVSTSHISNPDEVSINQSFTFQPSDAAYHLTLEIPIPIESVILQSFVPIDILESENDQAIISRTKRDADSPYFLLATYRCHEPTNRLEIRMRSVEGQYGEIQLLIIADMKMKIAQSLKLTVKPLSLHYRVNILSESIEGLSELRFSGSFSLMQMHEWVTMVVPDAPDRVQEDEITLYYRNAFLGSILVCVYRKGDATFRSDSVSTLAILKEIVTKEATTRKIILKMESDIKKENINALLDKLKPKLDEKCSLSRQMELIEAIREIEMQEENSHEWLSNEYKYILEHEDEIKENFKTRPRALEYLSGIVTDLYVDWYKFTGQNVQQNIPKLMKIMENYNFEQLVHFFHSKPL